jgi:hypothetical protein
MNMRRLAILGGLTAATMLAQTSGSITINGSIPSAVSITNASGAAISTTVSLGALTAANNNTLASITPVDVYVRSNQQYKLSASTTFTNSGAGTPDGGDSIAATDVGFGITAKDATGALVTSTYSDTITTKFNYITTPFSALSVTNGTTPFVAGTNGTLADIGSSTQVIQGSRVSQRGKIQTTTNSVKYATLPQYFTPTTGFQAVVTLTVATF